MALPYDVWGCVWGHSTEGAASGPGAAGTAEGLCYGPAPSAGGKGSEPRCCKPEAKLQNKFPACPKQATTGIFSQTFELRAPTRLSWAVKTELCLQRGP